MIRRNSRSPEFQRNTRTFEGGGVIPEPFDRSLLNEQYRLAHEKRKAHLERMQAPKGPQRFTEHELGHIPTEGEPELPIRAFKETSLNAIARHQVTILTAETGAGKSTQMPQYLMEAGYHVSMTQPRRISASFVAERIQEEVEAVLGEDVPYAGDLVGYHTAARNTTVEGHTRIEVVTDGLRLVQEFGERDRLENEVLIIDEVHEWNSNIEMLIARTRQLVKEKPDLRVLIMSATMQAEKLAAYFAGATGDKPPIIEVPGRNHAVTRIEKPDSTVVDEAVKYAEEGENILIFLPGVQEISDAIKEVGKRLTERGIIDITLLPLHSKLSQQEQDAVKGFYPGPKIIFATNIAQTSITIPDVNVVIDSGLERRVEIDDQGIQGLHLRYASRADMDQRAGRTGRVAPGTYINTALDKKRPYVAFGDERRTDYPIPEILRTNVNRNTLRAAANGIDFQKLKLFHPVERSIIEKAKKSLMNLGALDDEGNVTPRGLRMDTLPMRPEYARMIIEAEDKGFPVAVRHQVAAMAAVMETGGLTSWVEGASRTWRELSEEEDSDFITQLDVFVQTRDKTALELETLGLDIRNMERAKELYSKLVRRLNLTHGDEDLEVPTADERALLTTAVTAGLVNFVYLKAGDKYVSVDLQADRHGREFSGRTTVQLKPQLVVGTPIRIEKMRGKVPVIEHVLQDVTATTRAALAASAMNLLSWENGPLRLSDNRVQRIRKQLFRNVIDLGITIEEDAEPSADTTEFMVRHMMNKSGDSLVKLKELKKDLETLQHLTKRKLNVITQQEMESLIRESIKPQNLDLAYTDYLLGLKMQEKNLTIESRVPDEIREEIARNTPLTHEYQGRIWNLEYRHGIPLIRISEADVEKALKWTEPPTIPGDHKDVNDREVKLLYKGRAYYLSVFKKLDKANKLSR